MPGFRKPRSSFGKLGELTEMVMGELPLPAATTIGPGAVPLAERIPYLKKMLGSVLEDYGVMQGKFPGKDIISKIPAPAQVAFPTGNPQRIAKRANTYVDSLAEADARYAHQPSYPSMMEQLVNDLARYYTRD